MRDLICQMKEYIQPFERNLALQELRALVDGCVVPVNGDEASATTFRVLGSPDAETLRQVLAYWQSVGESPSTLTTQVRSEATASLASNGLDLTELVRTLEASHSIPLPRRRCLRYATHGLHEYRGKFFPQLVRALMNILHLSEDATVVDPMCGSGTTLVEARLSRRRSYGLDINPLSVFVTDAKCSALSLLPSQLIDAHDGLHDALSAPAQECSHDSHFSTLPPRDRAYLTKWFSPHALAELDQIHTAIHRLTDSTLRQFYFVSLSNILRRVSFQKTDDLRVRRDNTGLQPGETVVRFLSDMTRSTKTLLTFLIERGPLSLGDYAVSEADARDMAGALGSHVGDIDAIITSPPYATALPYIDTDRLSLMYLGLLPKAAHRARDTLMIGNREVTTAARREKWMFYEANRASLPQSTQSLIERINRLNRASDVGFRRRNLAALLSEYFFDMRSVMHQALHLLRRGGTLFLVVGNNRTTAGGQLVEIRTADHLLKIAEGAGFVPTDDIPMEMLVSRDIFRRNSMSSERILRLEKRQ